MPDIMGKDLDFLKEVAGLCTVIVLRIYVFPDLISGVIILIIVKYRQSETANKYNCYERLFQEPSQKLLGSFKQHVSRLARNKSPFFSDS